MIRVGIYMNRISLLIAMLMVISFASAQPKMSKENKMLKKEADYYFGFQDYRGALKIYEELMSTGNATAELQYKVGACILKTTNDRKAASAFFIKAGQGAYEESYFYLAQWYHLMEDFDKAREYYKKYALLHVKKRTHKESMDHYIQSCNTAERMIGEPIEVTIENMGEAINSEYAEYVPVISMDETSMMFTSRRPGSTGGKTDPYNRYFEDVYIATQSREVWSRPELIGSNINTDNHDASVGLSADGFTLITYKTNGEGTGGDLYWSLLDGESWTLPTKFPDGINSEHLEPSASFSSGMTELYFSSDRPGGLGGLDIYKVRRLPNGEWGIPMNLGSPINTSYDDDAPFIHPDDRTLYFSSKGHQTMGGYDIFKATLNDDGTWETVENLGYPINTTDDDIYFVLSADGKRGYLSSGRIGGYGEQDIYVVHLTDDVGKLTIIKGVVSIAENDTTLVPFGALIKIYDVATQKLQGIYRSNSHTGKYLVVVPPGKKFKMTVEVEGYKTFERDWFFDHDAGFKIVYKEIELRTRIEERPR